MALVLNDRVKETATVSGTGNATLAGADTGFVTFQNAIGNGNSTYYTIVNATGDEWEVGLGTYTSSSNTLSRDTIFTSTNSNNKVTFTPGEKTVFVTFPASKAVSTDMVGTMYSQNANNVSITGGTIGGQDVVGFGQAVVLSKLNLMGL